MIGARMKPYRRGPLTGRYGRLPTRIHLRRGYRLRGRILRRHRHRARRAF